MAIAIIGGTGIYDLGEAVDAMTVATPYGDAAVFQLAFAGRDIIFLTRHGAGHTLPPHRINYRANIWALQALGVTEVLATQAVGSMNPRMAPGDFAVLAQFIDWTKGRPSTFFSGEDGPVIHVDVTNPYCPRMIEKLLRAGDFLETRLHPEAVYACTEGPRFETAAEVAALRILGADVVGMTSVPETVLAREAGLCYAGISIVCNWAAGMADMPLTMEEVHGIMSDQATALRLLVERYLVLDDIRTCTCPELGFGQYLTRMQS